MNDKEGRKWLLQKLYNNGIKYIAYSPFYGGYVGVKETPIISGKGEVVNDTKIDTPIKIERGNGVVMNRHFATFDNGKVYYYRDGRTSWSNVGTKGVFSKNVILAGGDDEN